MTRMPASWGPGLHDRSCHAAGRHSDWADGDDRDGTAVKIATLFAEPGVGPAFLPVAQQPQQWIRQPAQDDFGTITAPDSDTTLLSMTFTPPVTGPGQVSLDTSDA